MRARNLLTGKNTLIIVLFCLFAGNNGFARYMKTSLTDPDLTMSLYDHLQLAKMGLKKNVFEKALAGWENLKKSNKLRHAEILSIADLSQSSNNKRLYVIDMEKKTVVYNTYVSHGRNSGNEFAKSFGNKPQCYKTSLGFYATGNTYQGAHGLSLRLNGLEPGINHRALERGIVIHGASYVSENFIKKYGRLGRSQGCPAVPEHECEPIVNKIKDGTCFFVFYPDSSYFNRSVYID